MTGLLEYSGFILMMIFGTIGDMVSVHFGWGEASTTFRTCMMTGGAIWLCLNMPDLLSLSYEVVFKPDVPIEKNHFRT